MLWWRWSWKSILNWPSLTPFAQLVAFKFLFILRLARWILPWWSIVQALTRQYVLTAFGCITFIRCWCCGTALTAQKSSLLCWAQLWNRVRVHSYAHKHNWKVLKHVMYIQYDCEKQSKVVYSLNHDITASFTLNSDPELPISDLHLPL